MLQHLTKSATYSLHQLDEVLEQTSNVQYATGLSILFGSSIGMHVRHIIEFYQCMLKGVSTSSINYDARERNLRIESDIEYARTILAECIHEIESILENKELILMTSQDLSSDYFRIPTNSYRELTYLIEHTIHHMAIIRMAYNENFSAIKIHENFGVANSTIKHKQVCAQ